ncbi:MAG: MFS transporter [Actinomycetota bacterium]
MSEPEPPTPPGREPEPPEDETVLPPPLPPELREPGVLARIRRHALDLSPVRASRDFRLLFAGQALSELGSHITFVAVPFQVYEITGNTLAVGLIGLCELVPLLVLPILGGAIADAVERRRMLLVAHVLTALLSAALVANARLAHPRLWALYVFAFLAAGAYGLYSPALRAWPARLLPVELLPSAMAMEATTYNIAQLAGPALGGVLIASVGLAGAYAVDVLSFVAGFAFVAAMRPSPPTAERAGIDLTSIREGLRFLRGKRVLQATFWVDINAMVFGMPMALFPAFARDVLGSGPRVLGLLYAAPAAGSLLAGLGSGRARHVRRQGRAIMVAVVCWGAAIAGFGLSTTVWAAIAFLALAGAADMVSGIFRDAVLKTTTPDEMRGRLEGVSLSVVAGGPSLGDLEAGALASVTSVPFSIVSGGLACIVGVGVLAAAIPQLARYDAAEARRQAQAQAPSTDVDDP